MHTTSVLLNSHRHSRMMNQQNPHGYLPTLLSFCLLAARCTEFKVNPLASPLEAVKLLHQRHIPNCARCRSFFQNVTKPLTCLFSFPPLCHEALR